MNDTIYLGDAVYAHFDGYGTELKLNDRWHPTEEPRTDHEGEQ
jgi:hypothetical protein